MNNIRDSNQVDTFINLITVLADGQLKTYSNIVWKSALYCGLWSSCGSTHRMRFDEEFVNFWSLNHIMFGVSTLNVLRGPVHFGKVVEEISAKNHCDPIRAECNCNSFQQNTFEIEHKLSQGSALWHDKTHTRHG